MDWLDRNEDTLNMIALVLIAVFIVLSMTLLTFPDLIVWITG